MNNDLSPKKYNGIICNSCGCQFYDKNPGDYIKNMSNDGKLRTKVVCEGCDTTHFRVVEDSEVFSNKQTK